TVALEKGAVHRAPDSGDPKTGGNFVIAAHRFNLGLTPNSTRAKSPFYHIDSLEKGDQIYIDYEGKRYVYEIYEKSLVPPTAIEIEQRTEKPRLTMYSCELAGPTAGREVVYAKPIGTVAWSNGKPGIEAL
ncbi:class E sortase, partial [Candidatus Saccharibacteria bacterium]|nr:class E sortase [Candidatus Saccharibacteria bacterium]